MSCLPVRLILTASVRVLGQAAMEMLMWQHRRHGHTPNSNAHLLALMSHTHRRLLPVALSSLARRSCPSWQILWMKDLLQPRQPGKTTAWALNDFQQWMAIIIVTLLHAVHVYRYYVYQLFYYNETAIQHLMTSCMPEGGKYKLYFPLYSSGRENILVIPRLV